MKQYTALKHFNMFKERIKKYLLTANFYSIKEFEFVNLSI